MKLVRAEREHGGSLLFIVAGELGAVELRIGPGYSSFYVHTPVYREDVAARAVQARAKRGRGSIPGLAPHRCHILEIDCWCGLVPCGTYDFDAPDVDTVPQWAALEELYQFHLAGAARGR